MADAIRRRKTEIERFEPKLSEDVSGCWIWTGSKNRQRSGYGSFTADGRKHVYAHRWSYEYHIAPIPDGLQLDHLCRNPSCVNPWHLEPVTPVVNMARGMNAQKTHCPQGHPYDDENTYNRPEGARGRRDCRECKREAYRKWRSANPRKPKAPSPFCKNGHPMSGDNLAVSSTGVRVCRACRSAAAAIANQKRWGSKPA